MSLCMQVQETPSWCITDTMRDQVAVVASSLWGALRLGHEYTHGLRAGSEHYITLRLTCDGMPFAISEGGAFPPLWQFNFGEPGLMNLQRERC